MLSDLWIILFIIAILLMIIIAELDYHEFPIYWPWMLTLLDTIICFLLAAAIFEIEFPWTMFNVTSGFIETGINTFSSKVSPEISYFCLMMALSMMGYGAYAFLSTFKTLYNEHGRLK